MPIKLKGEVCFTQRCSKLRFTDTTGLYDAVSNPTGWGGGVNPDGVDVTAATLTITYPSGATQVVDLLSQIPAAITGDIVFSDTLSTFGSYPDGYYELLYSVEVAGLPATYTVTVSTYNYCNAICYLDGEWAKVAEKMCDPCNYKEFLAQTLEAEAVLTALKYSAGCGTCNDTSDKLIDILIAITQYGGCNCE